MGGNNLYRGYCSIGCRGSIVRRLLTNITQGFIHFSPDLFGSFNICSYICNGDFKSTSAYASPDSFPLVPF